MSVSANITGTLTLISEDDVNCVRDILQSTPVVSLRDDEEYEVSFSVPEYGMNVLEGLTRMVTDGRQVSGRCFLTNLDEFNLEIVDFNEGEVLRRSPVSVQFENGEVFDLSSFI